MSAGFNIGDLNYLIDAAVMSGCMDGRERINKDDFINGLETLKKSRSKSLGLAEVPSVKWEDVGGLHEVKRELLQVLGKQPSISILFYFMFFRQFLAAVLEDGEGLEY